MGSFVGRFPGRAKLHYTNRFTAKTSCDPPSFGSNPSLETTAVTKPLRFVILEHNHPMLHWDLMLESENALRTWRLLEEPGIGKSVSSEPLADHRIEYLDYEGPVSGNRGVVKQWAGGTFEWLGDEKNSVQVKLSSVRILSVLTIEDTSANFREV